LRRILRRIFLLLKDKKASPLLEEGMLIGLAIMTLTVVFSIIVGILGGVQDIVKNLGFATEDFMNALNELWTKIMAFLGLRG